MSSKYLNPKLNVGVYLLVYSARIRDGPDSTVLTDVQAAGVRDRLSISPKVGPVQRAVGAAALQLRTCG